MWKLLLPITQIAFQKSFTNVHFHRVCRKMTHLFCSYFELIIWALVSENWEEQIEAKENTQGCPLATLGNSGAFSLVGWLAHGRLFSAGLGITQCNMHEFLALLEKCFPGQFLPTHFNWVSTWQLDNSLIFICAITSPCKSRRCYQQGRPTQQPGRSDAVIEVGSPFVTVMQVLLVKQDWEKELCRSWYPPDPILSISRKLRIIANIYLGHTYPKPFMYIFQQPEGSC